GTFAVWESHADRVAKARQAATKAIDLRTSPGELGAVGMPGTLTFPGHLGSYATALSGRARRRGLALGILGAGVLPNSTVCVLRTAPAAAYFSVGMRYQGQPARAPPSVATDTLRVDDTTSTIIRPPKSSGQAMQPPPPMHLGRDENLAVPLGVGQVVE